MGTLRQSTGRIALDKSDLLLDNLARTSRYLRPSLLVWWLIPFIGAALVLGTSYAALCTQRYTRANGVTGELLAGQSVGQSFVSRYPNLSGVELQIGTYALATDPSRAPLVLHLRSSPTSQGASRSPDIATAQLSPQQALGENPWYLFSFPSVQDSQDRSFYIEVESPGGAPGKALTLFWWQPTPDGDSYGQGTAYRDGKPQKGDLTFGLRYSPSPLQAWTQLARAASTNFPGALMVLVLLAVVGGGLWLALRLPTLLRDTQRMDRWLTWWSLPVALGIAALNGLVYLFLIPPWQGPDEHSHFTYAALLDRHGLDDARVQRLDLAGKDRDDALIKAVSASMDRNDFSRRVAWNSTPGAPVVPGSTLYQELRQPPAYYWLCAAALQTARAVGISADPYSNPQGALYVMRGVSLALGLGVVVLAWLAGVLLGGRKHPWLRLALPLIVGLLPMRAFVASAVNNDILAELAVSALFVALAALFRWPTGIRGLALAVLAIALTVVGLSTKSTAQAAAVPLLALGLTVWIGMLVSRVVVRWSDRAKKGGKFIPVALPATLIAVALLLSVGAVTLAYEQEDTAAGWLVRTWIFERAARVETNAHSGAYVIELRPPGETAVASQVLVPPVDHQRFSLTLSGWVRLRPGPGGPTGKEAKALISVLEGERQAGIGEVTLDPRGDWIPVTATARIHESADPVTLQLRAGDTAVQFDDLSLQVTGSPSALNDPIYRPVLLNPSAEKAGVGLRHEVARLLPEDARQIADALVNPQPFNRDALWASYADAQNRSFWGNFGWVSLPLPEAMYTILGAISLLALAGLAWLAVRRWGRWPWGVWLGLASLVALLASVLIGFAKQMMLLAVGVPAYPQGRYLFVLIIPIAWLLLSGTWGIWSLLWSGAGKLLGIAGVRHSLEQNADQAVRENSLVAPAWGVWLVFNSLFAMAAFCLLTLIGPYYYG